MNSAVHSGIQIVEYLSIIKRRRSTSLYLTMDFIRIVLSTKMISAGYSISHLSWKLKLGSAGNLSYRGVNSLKTNSKKSAICVDIERISSVAAFVINNCVKVFQNFPHNFETILVTQKRHERRTLHDLVKGFSIVLQSLSHSTLDTYVIQDSFQDQWIERTKLSIIICVMKEGWTVSRISKRNRLRSGKYKPNKLKTCS